MTALIRFYTGQGRDARGRSLAELLAWDDDRLETVHDYIQWLFPLPEPSAFNAAAPILTPHDIAAFQAPALQGALAGSLARMRLFYRAERRDVWLSPGNHNLLRITRILRCLTLLGQRPAAAALLEGVLDQAHAAQVAGPVTVAYWRAALEGRAR